MPDLRAFTRIKEECEAAGAKLVAVSKTRSVAAIRALYELGHRDFGENRVAELVDKQAQLPADVRWHFIGHLQRNKVRDLVPFVDLVHAVDSYRLLAEIDKRAAAAGRAVPVLLQYHIAREDSKYGLTAATAEELLAKLADQPLPHAPVVGVMGMATYTDDAGRVTAEFAQLAQHSTRARAKIDPNQNVDWQLSMGMSGDFPLALRHGSTLVRVGSSIFGPRE